MDKYTCKVSVIIFTIVTVLEINSLSLRILPKSNTTDSDKHNPVTNNDYSNVGNNKIDVYQQRYTGNRESGQEESLRQEENDDDDDDTEESDTETVGYEDRNCTCSGQASCLCCIDLNLSFIDLGGPGCVKFAYAPINDSMAVDMSYGERLLHSSSIKRESSDPMCMDLFSDLAQMCTRFTEMFPVKNGVRGCVTVEPVLLGVVQASYNVGCFDMDHPGVQPPVTDESTSHRIKVNSTNEYGVKPTAESNEEGGAYEEEELAAVISQSAEEGIAWFNNILSSVFGEESINDSYSNNSTGTESYNKTEIRRA